MVTEQDIADDQLEYLRENPGVCAWGSTTGYVWLRHSEGQWLAATRGGAHRLIRYVRGQIFDEAEARQWLVSNPATMIPADDAGIYHDEDDSIWDDANEQDVFTDARRCFWCGVSEWSADLTVHETTDHGECDFCEDCRESWERAGELVA